MLVVPISVEAPIGEGFEVSVTDPFSSAFWGLVLLPQQKIWRGLLVLLVDSLIVNS